MAVGTLNTNMLALAFDTVIGAKGSFPADQVSNYSAMLYLFAGLNNGIKKNGDEEGRIMDKSDITGDYHELQLMMKLDAVTAVGTGNGQLAPNTPAVTNDAFQNLRAQIAFYKHWFWLKDSDVKKIAAPAAKGMKYALAEAKRQQLSVIQKIAADLNAVTDQSDVTIGTIWQGIDESNTYWDADRSQASNAVLRGNVDDSGGSPLTLSRIGDNYTECRVHGGMPNAGICSIDSFNDVRELLEGKITNTNYDTGLWMKYGGDKYRYGNTVFVLEPLAPTKNLAMVTTDTWESVTSDMKMWGPEVDTSRKAAEVGNIEYWFLLGSDHLNRNGRIVHS